MKKIIFGLITTILISNLTFGQATFEHSYISDYPQPELISTFYSSTGLNYFTYALTTKMVTIYNENHQQIKSIILPMDAGSKMNEIICITDNLFNSDNSLELLYSIGNQVILCNENGVILQTFDTKHSAFLKKNSLGVYKLIVYDFTGGSINFDVYSLTGTLSTIQQQSLKNKLIGYPNPVKDIVNISNPLNTKDGSSILKVFSVTGEKVLEKTVSNNNEDFIKLDVSNLPTGIYIYKINEYSNKFIKE